MPGSALYMGHVRHARYQPKRHRFRYAVFSMLVDIDAIAREARELRLLSLDRFNLFCIKTADFGPKDGSPIRPHIEELLAARGVGAPSQILMLCYPRILGYAFNPITAYYCIDEAGTLTTMIYEVRNTFGEDHIYVVSTQAIRPTGTHDQKKRFHVSPFLPMQGHYYFSTEIPAGKLRLVIRETIDGVPTLVASFDGAARALTDRNLLLCFARYPLMTLRVVWGIHYQAVLLFLKGISYFSRPQPPKGRVSYSGFRRESSDERTHD